MRIAVMCKSDRFGGGASRVGEDLCRMLNRAGHESHLYLSFSIGERTGYMRSLYSTRPRISEVARKINRASMLLGLPNLIPSELFYLWLKKRRFQYDLFHFHDLSTAISPFTPGSLVRRQPTVWTFHDCSGFTGGCIYPGDCLRYQSGCGQCPQTGSWPMEGRIDGTRILSRIKKRSLAQPQIRIVSPSQWMADLAMDSGLLSSPPRVIPNCVDIETFKPQPKKEVRTKLGLPVDRKIILFTAGPLHEERKGLRHALEAVKAVAHLNPLVLLIGDDQGALDQSEPGLEIIRTGYLRDEVQKAMYFASADVFLFTSLEDNLPLSILETMAVGTPVVGFNTGGVPEMIQQGHEGFLVPQRDGEGLRQGLNEALESNQAEAWGRAARERVERDFNQSLFLGRHLDLYAEAIEEFVPR